jgi:hypothetical protein
MAKTGTPPQHRARLGLAGLAAVIFLVLAATMVLRPQSGVHAQGMAKEPLAMLGLAPASPSKKAL